MTKQNPMPSNSTAAAPTTRVERMLRASVTSGFARPRRAGGNGENQEHREDGGQERHRQDRRGAAGSQPKAPQREEDERAGGARKPRPSAAHGLAADRKSV